MAGKLAKRTVERVWGGQHGEDAQASFLAEAVHGGAVGWVAHGDSEGATCAADGHDTQLTSELRCDGAPAGR